MDKADLQWGTLKRERVIAFVESNESFCLKDKMANRLGRRFEVIWDRKKMKYFHEQMLLKIESFNNV